MVQDLRTILEAFRSTHPTKRSVWRSKSYAYLAAGTGDQTVFLLPGGLGIGEPFFLHVLDLEQDFQVIAPSYPDVKTLDELAEGIHHIAKEEGATRYSIVGQSAGGIVAQVLVRKFPQHIDKIVLAHTSTVTRDTPEQEIAARVSGMKQRLRLLRLIPYFVVKRKLTNSIDAIVATMASDELAFWRGYFEYVFGLRTRRDQIAMMNVLIDFAAHYRFGPGDLDQWPGRMLILDSDADKSIPQTERERVRMLHPRAELHTFEQLGHLSILSERETYLRLIRAFMTSQEPE